MFAGHCYRQTQEIAVRKNDRVVSLHVAEVFSKRFTWSDKSQKKSSSERDRSQFHYATHNKPDVVLQKRDNTA